MRMRMLVAVLAGVVLWLGLGTDGAGSPVNLYWDANGAGAGTGGTGEWNLTDQTWRLVSASGDLQAWQNGTDGNRANLGGTVGTLTLGADITVSHVNASSGYIINPDGGGAYKLTFDSTSTPGEANNYGIMLSGGPVTINAPVVLTGSWNHDFRGNVTFNGVVSDTGSPRGILANNSNTLTFNNANTFTGGIRGMSAASRIAIGHDQGLGTGPLATSSGWYRSVGAHRSIANPITPVGGVAYSMQTDGSYNLTLSGGPGTGTVGGWGMSFTVSNPVLTINRPLYSFLDGAASRAIPIFTKSGTGTLVLNQSTATTIGIDSGVSISAGSLILNGGRVGASTLNGTVVNGSPVITGLSSTAGLRVGQEVTSGLSFGTVHRRVIVSIDSATQVTLGEPTTSASGSYNITFSAAGALGLQTGNMTVAGNATLGGNGTIVMGSGKAVTVNAGGTIAPGSITEGAQVGTLTFTNNAAFTFAENAIYAWQYADGVGDRVQVYGTLTLPNVATVNVSQVSGEMPTTPTLFTATTLAGASDLSDWVIHGLQNYTVEIVGGTDVILKAPPRGTLIMLQ